MKKLAVLTHSLKVEYALDVLNGITGFFADKDVMLFIAQTKEPHCPIGVYEYQCWCSAEFLFSDQIDAYLIITGSYSSNISSTDFSKALEKIGNRPVISISVNLDLPNVYCSKIETKSVYLDVVKHLKEKHGCKKIAFMSANATKSVDALTRYEDFKEAMEKNGLDLDPALVFEGGFRRSLSSQVIKDKYKRPEDINFDAIVCANDVMAVGVQESLQEIGVSIPGQVIVFGFDDTIQASSVYPKISTIDQDTVLQGYNGAKLAYEVLCGKEVSRMELLPGTPIYRQSCGCVPLNNTEDVYCNSKGDLLHKSEIKKKIQAVTGHYFDFLNGIDSIYTLFDLTKSASTLRKFFFVLKYMMESAKFSSMAVFFFDKPVCIQKVDEYKFPENVRLSMYVDEESETEIYEPGIYLDWKKKLVSDMTFGNNAGGYLFQPIFSGESVYGYTICKPKSVDYSIYSVYMKIIINALAQAYEYTDSLFQNQRLLEENQLLQKSNTSLDNQSKTDELTKILNRRGFMELGQKALDIARGVDSQGLVIFFDMDGLKGINDTYGHEMGDMAIKSMAKVLTAALRSNDVIGRIGGDEFAAVATGIKSNQIRNLRRRIKKLCDDEAKKNKYPFKLSCSAGVTVFNAVNCNLNDLLSESDGLLYEEKKLKHAKNKK